MTMICNNWSTSGNVGQCRKTSHVPRLLRLSLTFLILFVSISGCTTFNPIDQTGETINRNATSYSNNATLLNVVRASLSEPLTFITITGLDGTSSMAGSLGLPSITLGPVRPNPSRTYTFGSNSVSRTNSNTFHISVVDDPASFTALLAPLNPAMIGFFIRQGYPRELLFFLFADRLREVKTDDNGNVTQVVKEWVNDPNLNTQTGFGCFAGKMASLLRAGLTAEIDVSNVPTGRALPLSRLCIDTTIQKPNFVAANAATLPNVVDTCESENWIVSQGGGASPSATAGSGSSTGGTGASGNAITVGPDNSLWVSLGNQGKVVRITHDAKDNLAISAPIDMPASPKQPRSGPYVAYPLRYMTKNGDGKEETIHYQLFMRSTYGVYNYLGALLHKDTDVDNLLAADESGYGGMVKILKQTDVKQTSTNGCFAAVDYRDVHYCVPNSSNRTKSIFALIHQLQELNTAPSNSPTTLTVVPVP